VLKGVNKNLSQYNLSLNKIGIGITALGAAIVGSMVFATKSFYQAAEQLNKMQLMTGMSAGALQELRYAAAVSGSSMEELEGALGIMFDRLQQAKDGASDAVKNFSDLGINLRDLFNLNPDEQFKEIARSLMEIEDPLKRLALARDIFGKSGTGVLETFEDLLRKMDEANKKGWVLTPEQIAAAKEFTDSLKNLTAAWELFMTKIGAAVGPLLTPLFELLGKMLQAVADWATENPKLTTTILSLVGAIGGISTVIGPLLLMLPGLAAIAGALGVSLGSAILIFGGVALAIGAVVAAGVLLAMNWDWVMEHLAAIWDGIKKAAVIVFGPIFTIISGIIDLVIVFVKAWDDSKGILANIWNGIKQTFFGFINPLIDRLNSFLNLLNRIPGVNIGSIGRLGEDSNTLPTLATGADNVLASASPIGGGDVNITVQGSIMSEDDFMSNVREAMLDIKARNVSTGIA
jgi:hypothetical protein